MTLLAQLRSLRHISVNNRFQYYTNCQPRRRMLQLQLSLGLFTPRIRNGRYRETVYRHPEVGKIHFAGRSRNPAPNRRQTGEPLSREVWLMATDIYSLVLASQIPRINSLRKMAKSMSCERSHLENWFRRLRIMY